MRFIAVLSAVLTLAACASTAPTTPSTNTIAAPNPAAASRVGQMLSAAGRPDAPTQAQIERALGNADITRRDGAGAALTYRLESCALLLVFAADTRNEMRLAEAHPSARNGTSAAPSLETCATELNARRP